MDWDKLRIFHAVADAGSLTHAGDSLHLSQSAVSRQIRALEESLNTTLFRRHARGLLLTEQGELLFDATRTMTKRLEAAAARIRDSEDEVHGELRVTTTTGFGTLWLAPRLHKLFHRYPNLKIDLMLEERILDLPMREADVAIRLKEPSQAELIRRRLMDVHIRLFASSSYVAEHGLPRSTAELAGHRLITQSPASPQVRAGMEFVQRLLAAMPPSSLAVNNYFGILQGVIHGLGIGSLPDYLTSDFPNLVNILPKEKSAPIPIYLAYVEELRHSKRVCAFRDFMVEEIAAFKRQGEPTSAEQATSHAVLP
jgi:DNA-binding transcriptional LysR family regulator